MSRHKISNYRLLMHGITTFCQAAKADGHRALWIMESPPNGYLQGLSASVDAPYLGPGNSADRADRITGILGQEFELLIHETDDAVDAGLLAALAGTVRAGGLLILGLPFTLEYSRSTGAGQAADTRFNQRLARLLLQSMSCHPSKIGQLREQDIHLPEKLSLESRQYIASEATDFVTPPPTSHQLTLADVTALQEQDKLLHSAINHLQQHPRACLTITGRRGRGKSTLLGRIAASLQQQKMSVAMTAARRSALHSVEKQGVSLSFLAATEAVHSGCHVLLVDEAASLPIDLLTQYLQHHDHVIYCTTVEGYEQAGRAFEIRFAELLNQQHREVLSLYPHTAWRWAAGDPLEAFIDALLLTGQEEPAPFDRIHQSNGVTDQWAEQTTTTDSYQADRFASALCLRRLDRAALAQDEDLLSSVFSLLRDNHYQTTASDIAHLLDGPGLQIWVLEDNQMIQAALLLAVEGEIDPQLHECIVSKQRRLPHQLLPQLLAQCANQTAPLKNRMARIIRIAVVPARRRQGLGSHFLQRLSQAISKPEDKVTALGASFAGDSAKLAFWQTNGFTRFHTGFRRNPRTGVQAVTVLKTMCEDSLAEALHEAARIHDDNRSWQEKPPGNTGSDPADTALLERFANGQRSVMDSYGALRRLAMRFPIPLSLPADSTRRQHEVALRTAVHRILQSQDDDHLSKK